MESEVQEVGRKMIWKRGIIGRGRAGMSRMEVESGKGTKPAHTECFASTKCAYVFLV